MEREISTVTKENSAASLYSSRKLARASDGNLLPEERKRLIKQIADHTRRRGNANISEIAIKFGISRPTARTLVQSLLHEWNGETFVQTFAQIKWIESMLDDLDAGAGPRSKEEIAEIKLKLSLLGRLHALQSSLYKTQRADRSVTLHLHTLIPQSQADSTDHVEEAQDHTA